MDLIHILHEAIRFGASDIHLSVGCPPMVRIQGSMTVLPSSEPLSAERCKKLVYSVLLDEQRARFESRLELDCSVTISQLGRFRMNVLTQQGGVEAVLRYVPQTIPSAEFLGLGPQIMALGELPNGLVLVTGPTGSGKTTTLAALIQNINVHQKKHILTIEDPIEFVYKKEQCLIRQREVGPHTHSFQEALRHAMRQDPDVILIGELRDLETISLALTAAETGHLCLATLHTSDATQTVDRIIDVFPSQQQQQVRIQLSMALKAVVSQILLPRQDNNSRVAAREVMLVNSAIANIIRDGKTHMIPNMIETSGKAGMYTMDRSLTELARRRLISQENALSMARNPQTMSVQLRAGASLGASAVPVLS